MTDFFNKPNEYNDIKKNEYLILFRNWYHVGTVIRVSMSLFFGEKKTRFSLNKDISDKKCFHACKKACSLLFVT